MISFSIKNLFLVAALVGGIFICGLGIIGHDSQNTQSCSSSCHTHGGLTEIAPSKKLDESEKKPTPPPIKWPTAEINLLVLYSLPILVYFLFSYKRLEIHLTTQLRV